MKCFRLFAPFSESISYTLTQGDTRSISCSSSEYIDITYGRYYCWYSGSTVTSKIRTNCNYNYYCTIQAQNSWLDTNPCSGTTKTLAWTYYCRCKFLSSYILMNFSILTNQIFFKKLIENVNKRFLTISTTLYLRSVAD